MIVCQRALLSSSESLRAIPAGREREKVSGKRYQEPFRGETQHGGRASDRNLGALADDLDVTLPWPSTSARCWLGAGSCIARIASSKPGSIPSQRDFRCQRFPSARAALRSPSLARHRGAVVRHPCRMLEGHFWLISPGGLIVIDPADDAGSSAFAPGSERPGRFSSPWIEPQGVDPRRTMPSFSAHI